jgi:hypothetical protein
MSKLTQAVSIVALAAAASTAGAWYAAPPAPAMTQAPQPAAVEQGATISRPLANHPFGAGHAFPEVPPMPEFGQYPAMPEMPAFGQFPNRPEMPPMPAFGQHPAMPEMPTFGQFPNRPDMPPMPAFGQYPALPEMPAMPFIDSERPAMPEAFEARIKEMEARRVQAKQQMEERRAAMKREREQRRALYVAHGFDAGRNANAPCAPAQAVVPQQAAAPVTTSPTVR